jgi:predicted membrane protein
MRLILRVVAALSAMLLAVSIVGGVAAAAMRKRVVRADAPELDEVHLAAFFEALAFRSTATAFRGGTIDMWYGGGIVDLRGATLDPSGAVLQVRAVFGGCQIAVPDDWVVVTHVRGIGGASDTRTARDRPADAPWLAIEGIAAFGGVGISSEVPEGAASDLGA